VKEERVGHKTRYSLFMEAISTYSIGISVFYLAVFLLLAGMQLLAFIWDINTIIFSMVSLIISYMVFFVPFAMVIDDYSMGRAMTAALDHLRTKPFDPLKWFIMIMAANLAVVFLLQLVMDYQLAKGIATFINGLIVLPFMIIYGAHMYVDKYPMTRR
jgi:glucan phosphoethanolaminetransferase (alkaline phosphatase superfamily)